MKLIAIVAIPHESSLVMEGDHTHMVPTENCDKTLMDRCELVGIDFFTSVPGGGDVYILKRIPHDRLGASVTSKATEDNATTPGRQSGCRGSGVVAPVFSNAGRLTPPICAKIRLTGSRISL